MADTTHTFPAGTPVGRHPRVRHTFADGTRVDVRFEDDHLTITNVAGMDLLIRPVVANVIEVRAEGEF